MLLAFHPFHGLMPMSQACIHIEPWTMYYLLVLVSVFAFFGTNKVLKWVGLNKIIHEQQWKARNPELFTSLYRYTPETSWHTSCTTSSKSSTLFDQHFFCRSGQKHSSRTNSVSVLVLNKSFCVDLHRQSFFQIRIFSSSIETSSIFVQTSHKHFSCQRCNIINKVKGQHFPLQLYFIEIFTRWTSLETFERLYHDTYDSL